VPAINNKKLNYKYIVNKLLTV